MKTIVFSWLCGLFFWASLQAAPPSVLYLTWMHDPTSTMTIHWHTRLSDADSHLWYRKEGASLWHETDGAYTRIRKSPVRVHTVELDGLDANTEYEFQLEPQGQVYRFKTLPQDLSQPVKFVIGGDAYCSLKRFRKMNRQIAEIAPDFVVVGGDIAYTNGFKSFFKGLHWQLRRWRTFLKEWASTLVTPEGRLIPLIPVLGNHDIRGVSLRLRQQHPLFYQLFALGGAGRPYRCLDCGDYLRLFLLDTGHGFQIDGEQASWLEQQLQESFAYKLAVYHISAYPSAYPYDGAVPRQLRAAWVPLFERYRLHAAFEHHNHAYKRTYPLKQGEIDPEGVIYMGDGSWGISPRLPKKYWYLEQAKKVNAVCVVTLEAQGAWIEALDNQGVFFDSVAIAPRGGTQ